MSSGCANRRTASSGWRRSWATAAAYRAALAPLTEAARATLHRQAAACDAGQESRTVCAPVYSRLVRHYRSYLAYIDAAQAWKASHL